MSTNLLPAMTRGLAHRYIDVCAFNECSIRGILPLQQGHEILTPFMQRAGQALEFITAGSFSQQQRAQMMASLNHSNDQGFTIFPKFAEALWISNLDREAMALVINPLTADEVGLQTLCRHIVESARLFACIGAHESFRLYFDR